MQAKQKVLIVFAHAEAKSFCAAIKDMCVKTLQEAGHEVQVSDLYKMKFFLPLDKTDFTELSDPSYFKPQAEQRVANEKALATFSPEVKAEHEKLRWSTVVLFIFPLYWFHLPGILKNWVDRILSYGFSYGGGKSLAGRKGMMLYTTGGPKAFFKGTEECIWKLINQYIFNFVGITPLEPYIAYSAAHVPNEVRLKYLEEVKAIMANVEARAEYKIQASG